ncbi:MAG: PIN/TRAM domain-containing protein [Planctomycetota bacterium]
MADPHSHDPRTDADPKSLESPHGRTGDARAAGTRLLPGRNVGPSQAEVAARQRRVLVTIIRAVFAILVATVALLSILGVGSDSLDPGANLAIGWKLTLTVALLFGAIVVVVDLVTPKKKISTLFSVFFGLVIAMLATFALGAVVDLFAQTYEIGSGPLIAYVKVIMGICLSYLAISTVLQTQDDFRLVIPYVEFAKQIRGARPLLVDSSALIDARILELSQTGLIQAPLVIPTFVVAELQQLSDSSDRSARQKGRRGLDVIGRLQRAPGLDVTLDETQVPGKAVDQMLVELARLSQAKILTGDTGLARVAAIQGTAVVNVHEVAEAMRAGVVPGERLEIDLVKPGEHDGQAVGFLEDGTMVVADRASDHIGERIEVEVTGNVRTAGGRLVFAKPVTDVIEPASESVGEQMNAEPTDGPAGEPEPSAESVATGDGAPAEAEQARAKPTRPRKSPAGRNPRR